MQLNKEKYKEAILLFLNSLSEVNGKKKFYKLFYFLDFDNFEKFNIPITGDTYVKKKYGPVPLYFDAMVEELQREGKIKVTKVRKNLTHENDTVVYKLVSKHASSLKYLTKNEKKMLDRIIDKYGKLSGKDLEALSHNEAPWNAVDFYEVIPYELGYYRNTDFSE